MHTDHPSPAPERGSIDAAGYRLAYLFLAYGILASVAWRAFASSTAGFDLLALVVLSGAVTALYQVRHGGRLRRSAAASLAAVFVALAVAVIVTFGA